MSLKTINSGEEIDFKELDSQIARSGLMKRNYQYYIFVSLFLFFGFIVSFYLLTFGNNLWTIIINIFLLGFIRLQGALLAHDFAHLQVLKSRKKNLFFASCIWAFSCFASSTWWEHQHNTHHKNTNQIGSDPDVDIPFTFDKKLIRSESFFYRKIFLPVQHFLLFPGLFISFIAGIQKSSWWILTNFNTRVLFEICIILFSSIGLLLASFYYLSWQFALFFLIGQLLVGGLYMSILFFPNHYGEIIIEEGVPYKRIYQILTSRNIAGGPITDFLLGGLNLQIEHHLYPTMPRIHLPKAKKIVKKFCREKQIPYHEVNIFVSFVEMFTALRNVAKNGSHNN